MHGTRGERYHHRAMGVVENGGGADGWNRRAVGKEKEKKRKQGKKKDFLGIEVREMGEAEQLNGRKAQAESRRARKELVSSIQV